MMLAEVRRTIPTLCGLPLQLAIDASLTSHVELKAKLNLVDLLHQRPDADSLVFYWVFWNVLRLTSRKIHEYYYDEFRSRLHLFSIYSEYLT